MCDYSLEHHASRPARVGEVLVTSSFYQSTTRGFRSPDDPHVAVCLLPGTELAFERPVDCATFWGLLFRSHGSNSRVARFRQVNMEDPHRHHDALEFPDGRIVLLTNLREGQRATVVQLPPIGDAEPKTTPHNTRLEEPVDE